MKKPLVSVIVVNFNQKKLTLGCLMSLRNVTYKNLEVILVDNGSDEKMNGLDKFEKCFKRFEVVDSETNLGFTGGNNLGLGKTKGAYILLLNNDTKVTAGFLEPLVFDMLEDRGLGIVQSKIRVMDKPEYLDSVASYLTFNGYLYHEGYLERDLGQFNELKYALSVKGACMLIRRSVLKLGLFDDDYFAYFEETDLCWRAWLLGYKVAFEPKSLIYHKMGATSSKMNNWFIQFHSFKNRMRTIIKNASVITLLWMIPLHMLATFLFMFYLLLVGKFKGFVSIVRAFCWNIVNLRKTLVLRSNVQAKRKIGDREIFSYTMKNPSPMFYLRHLRLLMKGAK